MGKRRNRWDWMDDRSNGLMQPSQTVVGDTTEYPPSFNAPESRDRGSCGVVFVYVRVCEGRERETHLGERHRGGEGV